MIDEKNIDNPETPIDAEKVLETNETDVESVKTLTAALKTQSEKIAQLQADYEKQEAIIGKIEFTAYDESPQTPKWIYAVAVIGIAGLVYFGVKALKSPAAGKENG